jgi:hypothetical protein
MRVQGKKSTAIQLLTNGKKSSTVRKVLQTCYARQKLAVNNYDETF